MIRKIELLEPYFVHGATMQPGVYYVGGTYNGHRLCGRGAQRLVDLGIARVVE